jgi:hypothetical protein
MRTNNVKSLVIVLLFLTSAGSFSQEQEVIYANMAIEQSKEKQNTMKTYVIEREIPDAGKLTEEQLKGISQKSNSVIAEMDSGIEWMHSYVTDNKVYCVYKAENQEVIKKHAEKGGFPANNITELATIIDPETAND